MNNTNTQIGSPRGLNEGGVPGTESQTKIDVSPRINEIERQISKIEKKIDKFNESVKDANLKTIETLGVFVALFTFISIEFQIFRSFSSWYAGASLSLIILGALTFFVLLIVALLNKKKQKYFLLFFIFPFVIISAGLIFWKYSTIIDSNYILKEEINKNFYAKEDLKKTIEENEKNKNALNCLKDKGYFDVKCFEYIVR